VEAAALERIGHFLTVIAGEHDQRICFALSADLGHGDFVAQDFEQEGFKFGVRLAISSINKTTRFSDSSARSMVAVKKPVRKNTPS
jgi:hypothetical protein